MTLEEFIDRFAFAIEVDPATLSADTDYKALPIWDSLNTLSVIAMADADFGVSLGGQHIESSATIGELWTIANAKAVAA